MILSRENQRKVSLLFVCVWELFLWKLFFIEKFITFWKVFSSIHIIRRGHSNKTKIDHLQSIKECIVDIRHPIVTILWKEFENRTAELFWRHPNFILLKFKLSRILFTSFGVDRPLQEGRKSSYLLIILSPITSNVPNSCTLRDARWCIHAGWETGSRFSPLTVHK